MLLKGYNLYQNIFYLRTMWAVKIFSLMAFYYTDIYFQLSFMFLNIMRIRIIFFSLVCDFFSFSPLRYCLVLCPEGIFFGIDLNWSRFFLFSNIYDNLCNIMLRYNFILFRRKINFNTDGALCIFMCELMYLCMRLNFWYNR